MQREGAYIAEVMKLMKYVECKEDSVIQIVRTHQYHTNSTLRIVRNPLKMKQNK